MTEAITWHDHPDRIRLNNELHARPFYTLPTPARISHVAMLTGEGGGAADREHVIRMCERIGVDPPAPDARHFVIDGGSFRLRWERHAEFSTYTVIVPRLGEDPFRYPAIGKVPGEWLRGLPGQRLVAVHLALLVAGDRPEQDKLAEWLVSEGMLASRALDDAAEIRTDLRIHEDGFSRIVVHNLSMNAKRSGRLVQRLLEIETYRMMALLALPLAHEQSGEIARIEDALSRIVNTMGQQAKLEDERSLLRELTALAAAAERSIAATAYRFSAAAAYHALVRSRIEALREQAIEGNQSARSFIERRLSPAMRTCQTVRERQEKTARRVARAADLLRTRIDVAIEEQNRDLLASMNRRARLQLRMQEMVEGLSVVAISYYALGLIGYVLKALKPLGLPVAPAIVQGAALPVVMATIWLGVRHLRRHIGHKDK